MNELFHIGDREAFEARFARMHPVEESAANWDSPCGRYSIEATRFTEIPPELGEITILKKPGGPDYCRIVVREKKSGRELAEIRRNNPNFWSAWVDHPNGSQHLVCAQDIAGYSVVNLTKGETHHYCPPAKELESAFEWVSVHPSPGKTRLAAFGWRWGWPAPSPMECALYDFSAPDSFPYRELCRGRYERGFCVVPPYISEDENGWIDDETYVYVTQQFYRRRDGKHVYLDLEEVSDAEQIGWRKERVTLRVGQDPEFLVLSDP